MTEPEEVGFRGLVQIGDQWFTQYPKPGHEMDTHEPEYVVTSLESVGAPVVFRTEIQGYHGFFRLDTSDVARLAPRDANTYRFVSEPQCEWTDGNPTHHTAMVQFYKATIDTSKRLVRSDTLRHDYGWMMQLMEKEAKQK